MNEQKAQILIIEDDQDDILLCELLFRESNDSTVVRFFKDLDTLLVGLQQEKSNGALPILILMNLYMPSDIPVIIQKVLDLHSENLVIHFAVMVNASTDLDYVSLNCTEIIGFILKPVRPEGVKDLINKCALLP